MEFALAREVVRWHRSHDGGVENDSDLKFHALRLLHEAVELCIATGADGNAIGEVFADELHKGTIRGEFGKINPSGMFEEIADVAILLEVLADQVDLSIDDAVRDKLIILNTPKWNCDEHGVLWRQTEESSKGEKHANT